MPTPVPLILRVCTLSVIMLQATCNGASSPLPPAGARPSCQRAAYAVILRPVGVHLHVACVGGGPCPAGTPLVLLPRKLSSLLKVDTSCIGSTSSSSSKNSLGTSSLYGTVIPQSLGLTSTLRQTSSPPSRFTCRSCAFFICFTDSPVGVLWNGLGGGVSCSFRGCLSSSSVLFRRGGGAVKQDLPSSYWRPATPRTVLPRGVRVICDGRSFAEKLGGFSSTCLPGGSSSES